MAKILSCVLIVLLSSFAQASSLNWPALEKEATKLKNIAVAKDEFAAKRKVSDIIKLFPSEDMKILGIDMKDWALKIGTLTYWQGSLASLNALPYWDKIKKDTHVMHEESYPVPSGVSFIVEGDVPDLKRASSSGMIIHRKRYSLPKGVSRVYSIGLSSGSLDMSVTDSKCIALEKEHSAISDLLDELNNEDALVVLPSSLFCPRVLHEKFGGWNEVQLGLTSDKDGNAIHYIRHSEPMTLRKHQRQEEAKVNKAHSVPQEKPARTPDYDQDF